jgi:hypothetical protein
MARGPKCRIDDGGRECTTCMEYKGWGAYSAMRAGAHGKAAKCKSCIAAQQMSKYEPKRVRLWDEAGRQCCKCSKYKLWAFFSKDTHHVTGHRTVCKECATKDFNIWKANNPEKYETAIARWLAENADYVRERAKKAAVTRRANFSDGEYASTQRAWRQTNSDHYREYTRGYRQLNKEKITQYNKAHRLENPHMYAAYDATKRAKRLERYVTWADQIAIEAIFEQARTLSVSTGVQHHVDHIYPMLGRTVSGLHVPGNLQILTANENLRKSNKVVHDFLPSHLISEADFLISHSRQETR